ncbi:hypothetical protein ACFX13_024718 [Malus domestica]
MKVPIGMKYQIDDDWYSSDPVLPMTLYPLCLANCPAYIPTAPAAAEIYTLEPGFGSASTSIPNNAANPGTPTHY